MGDFNNDTHETIYGSTPGTLILLNVYLSLVNGQHLISCWWLIFLLLAFSVFPEECCSLNPIPLRIVTPIYGCRYLVVLLFINHLYSILSRFQATHTSASSYFICQCYSLYHPTQEDGLALETN